MKRLLVACLLAGCGSSSVGPGPGPVGTATFTAEPSAVTLPTRNFHYDPLLTMRNAHGEPVWLDLRTDVQSISSNPEVATVDSRVRIRTTSVPGTADITVFTVADPSVRTTVHVTTVDAGFSEVRVEGPSDYDLHVGEGAPLNVTGVLTNGAVVPHLEYSADLDVLQGAEYAEIVDGVGLSALRATGARVPLAFGFLRGGARATGTLAVRELQLVGVDVQLGGTPSQANTFTMPAGYHAVLELVGTFEDGSLRPLELGRDYTVALGGEGFAFAPLGTAGATGAAGATGGDSGTTPARNGVITQPQAGRSATLTIDLLDEIDGALGDVQARVTTVPGTPLGPLSAAFTHYSDDRRLLPGLARELTVRADFRGLAGYRVSALDPLTGAASFATQGRALTGWPTLNPTVSTGAGDVQLTLAGTSATTLPVAVVTPRRLSVIALKDTEALHPVELGTHLVLETVVDYGDNDTPKDRTLDYPVLTPTFTAFFDFGSRFFLNKEGPVTFRAYDPEGRLVEPVGPGSQGTVEAEVRRQTLFD